MTWQLSTLWSAQSEESRDLLMDYFEGSRGVFDMINEEAGRFQDYWNDLTDADPAKENYYEEVSDWITNRFTETVTTLSLSN